MMPVGEQSSSSRPQGQNMAQPAAVHMMQRGMLPSQQMHMGMNQMGINMPMHRGQQIPPAAQAHMYPSGQNVWQPAGMTPGLMPTVMMPNAYGASPIAPPSYTPEMRKRFAEKQGQFVPHQHTNAQQWQQQQQQHQQQQQLMSIQKQQQLQQQQQQQLMKKRQREEQQRKFKQFNATVGMHHMSADSLIDSMIGKPSNSSAVKHPASHSTGLCEPELPSQDLENSFGDFMTGPTHEKAPPASSTPINNNMANVTNVEATTTVNEVVTEVNKKPNEDSVMTMMLQCSDLSAPSKASQFNKKPSMRDTPRSSSANHVEYQSSQKARRWDSVNDETLSELFTLPAATIQVPPPQHTTTAHSVGSGLANQVETTGEFVMPLWCSADGEVPIIYTHVLEAVTRDGKIDTNQVYPILLSSGLPREALGYIWGMCNGKTPGELCREELFLILAMIALAQNNQNIRSLSILRRCPQAPVPFFGQRTTSSHPSSNSTEAPTAPGSECVTNAASLNFMTPRTPMPEPNRTMDDDDDDFNEFKSAPPPIVTTPSSSSLTMQMDRKASLSSTITPGTTTTTIVSGLHHSSSLPGLLTAGVSTAPSQPVRGLSNLVSAPVMVAMEASKSVIGNAAVNTSTVDDDFGDFSSYSSNKPEQTCEQPEELMGSEDMYAALRNISEDTSTSWNVGVTWQEDEEENTCVGGEHEEFADFSQAFENKDNSANELTVDSQPFVNTDPIVSVPAATTMEDDFADFQSAVSSSDKSKQNDTKTDSSDFLNLASLVMDSSLYSVKPNISVDTPTLPDRGEPSPPPHEGNKHLSDMCNTTDIAFPSPSTEPRNTLPATMTTKPPTDSPYKNKSTNYFSRNHDIGSSLHHPAVVDSLPPELPDDEDDDYYGNANDSFDTFGTFQSNTLTGDADMSFSSLRVPYGGLADFEIDQVPAYSENQYDQLPTPLSDFGGWTQDNTAAINKEDVQSVNSLDLRPQNNSSSPPDSQSVASLELPATDGVGDVLKKVDSAVDTMSIASLELRKVSSEVVLAVAAAGTEEREEGAGDEQEIAADYPTFDDIVNPKAVVFDDIVRKPKDVCELLAESSLLTGDRYSQLSKEPQSIDRHMYHWQCCLEKCNDVIQQANDTFNSLSSSAHCQQLANSQQGSNYFHSVVEIYKVACRIIVAVKEASLAKDELKKRMKNIEMSWMNLSAFISGFPLMPEPSSLDFSTWSLDPVTDQSRACGVCLLDVDAASNSGQADHRQKLTFSGRQYHTSCANFWLNCVNCTLPALVKPQLL